MAELPHFTQGQFGKLNVEGLNDIVEAVLDNRQAIEKFNATSFPGRRGTAGNFPIIAHLTEKTGGGGPEPLLGDSSTNSYEWEEVWYTAASQTWKAKVNGRSYNSLLNNAAVRSGPLDADDEFDEDLSGSVVFLHPFNDNDGGSLLTFQAPLEGATVAVCIITQGGTDNPDQCLEVSGEPYFLRKVRYSGDSWVEYGPEFEAVNGPEVHNQGFVGGGISGTGDCDIEVWSDKITVGTLVLASKVGSSKWVFSITNDLCIGCCSGEGEGLRSQVTQTDESTRERWLARQDSGTGIKSTYQMSMYSEMIK